MKSRALTHAASDLYEPSKADKVSTIAAYSNRELIGYTSGNQTQRWEAARTASKALLDATTGYKLDYTAPAPKEEAIQNYEDIWLQGVEHGFMLDATPNDFVCGELEGALLACEKDLEPEIMLLEGQSGLRNPAGPCGIELLLGGACSGAILQHAPGRVHYEDLDERGCRIPPVAEGRSR